MPNAVIANALSDRPCGDCLGDWSHDPDDWYALRRDLARVGIHRVGDLEIRRLGDRKLLEPLFDEWIPSSFNSAGPGYLAYVPGGGLYPCALADFIADAVNRYTGVWNAAPLLVELEANVLRWLTLAYLLEGRVLESRGRREKARDAWSRALATIDSTPSIPVTDAACCAMARLKLPRPQNRSST